MSISIFAPLVAVAVPFIVQQIKKVVKPQYMPFVAPVLGVLLNVALASLSGDAASLVQQMIEGVLAGLAGVGGYEFAKQGKRFVTG